MNDQYPCEEWAEKLAARHEEDLTEQERRELEAHLTTCRACAAQFQMYRTLEVEIRELSSPEMPESLLPLLRSHPQKMMRLPAFSQVGQSKALEASSAPSARRLALVMDVNATAHLQQPSFAQRDALDFATTLQQHAGCWLFAPPIVGREATRDNIEHVLEQLAQGCSANDEIVLYFSFHGDLRSSWQWFLPHTVDSERANVLPYKSPPFFSAETLTRWIEEKLIGHTVLLILDACFLGGEREEDTDEKPVLWRKERFVGYFDRIKERGQGLPHRLRLIASAKSHQVTTDPNEGETLSNLLRQALLPKDPREVRRSAPDGEVDLRQVYRYLEEANK